ncbi:hypothetical protein BKA93DRAFT_827974 [Sparassis latifolia]|uniref:Uncharacterized protein n=1 Tax=Sparassis crispa TaxID=139825 RepID=A0A401GHZ5_9APHY|nr:hypothetical protein SCP_0401800 [Sparassis crispa]GBE81807.1 hypothetical protein SCP_0401800 [Sparassis crispa]
MAAAPNYDIMSQALEDLANELSLVAQAPAPQQLLGILQQLLQGQQQQIQGQHELQQQLVQVQQQLQQDIQQLRDEFHAESRLLPLRLLNLNAPRDAPLSFPTNVVLPQPHAQTKADLLRLTDAECQSLATALGIDLSADDLILMWRQQIMDYLGCGETAT